LIESHVHFLPVRNKLARRTLCVGFGLIAAPYPEGKKRVKSTQTETTRCSSLQASFRGADP
jgi:hypothetical protein